MDSEYVKIGDFQTRLQAVGHSIGIVMAAFFVGGLVLSTAGVLLLAPFVDIRLPDGGLTPFANAVGMAWQFIGFIVVVVGYLYRYEAWSLIGARLPTLRDLGYVVGGFLALLVLNIVLSVIISVIGVDIAQNAVVGMGQENPELFLYLIPINLLLVGPGEELLFRGVVQRLFKRAYGVVPAILMASAFFGVAHFVATLGQGASGIATYLAVAAVLGVVLGTVYELTNNIVVPAVIHGVWNAMQFATQWYVATHDGPEQVLVVLAPF
ncbi:Metal-dependent membrane protease, CAAX family [Halapricum desulfuricans]|uniref:Metal-dependent membrane protease, CAAX family n=1 Tax=Halapricum desulfuricans TaxID=2841257 RepID=A0A897NQG1_9EURY|nr:type II CAAX endopeptidase family protein [Halapricum desulfuricans]QSG12436.1 Metal-dependent membrane protease, CAAX family [Halapricum desulfuricans]